MARRRISKKQKAFINEYLQCWNATQAAIKVGYAKKSARMAGHRLVTNNYISAEIAKRVKEMCMSADEALKLLSDQARGSLTDIADIDEDGRWKFNFQKAKDNGKLHLVKKIIPSAYGTKIEIHDPQRALELIGKAHGLFTDKVDLTTKGEKLNKDDPEAIERSMDALAEAVRETISRQDSRESSTVETAQQTTVASDSDKSG